MAVLTFQVNGQHIVRTDGELVVAGSRNQLRCRFTFDPSWAGVTKTAIFSCGSTCYHVILTNDAIAPSAMPVFSAGNWKVSVFGGDLITADTATLVVRPSGYAEGTAPEAPTQTVYESLIARLDALAEGSGGGGGDGGGGTSITISGGTLYIGGDQNV